MASCNDSTQPFAKTICSICYQDLKPIVEDLQVISICGHVFHELCIQQWFEYPSKQKKKCPICKQMCSTSNVIRINFQSVSDSNLSHKLQTRKEDSEELKLEVKRLEGEINMINSALKSSENDLKFSNEELNKSELERVKLKDINNDLAQELAAQKLLYIELDSKYKTLASHEARSRNELEKAKEKLEKLKEKNRKLKTVDNDTRTLHDTIKEPDRETKRLRVSENINESNNEDGVRSYILIEDDAPMVSDSQNVHETTAADLCFSAGLVGPDGIKRHLGKWCKKSSS